MIPRNVDVHWAFLDDTVGEIGGYRNILFVREAKL